MHIHYNIICEDGKSGYEYLQRLSKYLRFVLCINKVTIKPISAHGGHYNNIKDTYRRIYKNKAKEKKELKEKIIILVDNDTYKRNDLGDSEKYQKKPTYLPNFIFHYFNFEDFLVMHYDDEIFEKWYQICKKHNHFNVPMHSEEYMPLINSIFPNYDKSSLPEDFSFNEQTLKNLFKHNGKYEFKSDFVEFLKSVIGCQ